MVPEGGRAGDEISRRDGPIIPSEEHGTGPPDRLPQAACQLVRPTQFTSPHIPVKSQKSGFVGLRYSSKDRKNTPLYTIREVAPFAKTVAARPRPTPRPSFFPAPNRSAATP